MEKDNFANRSDVTISSLRKELQSQQDRLHQVESSLKHHITAEEEAASKAAKWESKVCVVKLDLFVLYVLIISNYLAIIHTYEKQSNTFRLSINHSKLFQLLTSPKFMISSIFSPLAWTDVEFNFHQE